ncbi:MAG TPA: hypothetical protein VGL63_03785 [Streptosporangiaceae bacterium]
MRRRTVMIAAVAVLSTAFVTSASASAETQATAARAPSQAGTWGTAAEIPNSMKLNHGGQAGVGTISCPVTAACSAGGSYTSHFTSGVPTVEAFVVNKSGGKWRAAKEVPGTDALNVGGKAKTVAVSCASTGNCGAGGTYTDAVGHAQPFVVDETGSVWGTAEQVPGIASLNVGKPGSQITSLSCGGVGDCSAGGFYSDASGHEQAFVVTETGGVWGNAQEVPGTAALNAGGSAQVQSVSCKAGGNCTAGGFYASSINDTIPTIQAFVVDETDGTWGTAQEVPGTAALNGGGFAVVFAVSCASAGNCSAGGEYTDSTPATQAFVVDETGGTWGTAEEIPGISALNVQKLAAVNSISCTAPGDCTAGGVYQDGSFNGQAFVVDETGGTWGTAEEIPGTAALDQGAPGANTNVVSCASPGNCSAGGFYTDASGHEQAYVVSEVNGTWGTAEEVPGTAALNVGGVASVQSLSCAPAGRCSAGGQYANSNLSAEVFTVNQAR